MAGMMGSKQIYKNSPKLSRDENGKMGVQKPAAQSGVDEADEGESGMPVHEHDMHARHNLERHMIHAKHEHEHAMHKGGDKSEMHARHGKEVMDMIKRHDGELGGGESGGRKDAMEKGE